MKAKKILYNKDYTLSNITRELKSGNYNHIHMATHGVFGNSAKNSFLLTYDNKINMNMLEQLMSISKIKDHQVDLLTLSACQTALGNERSALGLAGVSVKAGVKNAIATLWFVSDEATSLAVRELYRQLKKPGTSKAQALQNSQKMLISKSRFKHPVYWAPFLLIGSWM